MLNVINKKKKWEKYSRGTGDKPIKIKWNKNIYTVS